LFQKTKTIGFAGAQDLNTLFHPAVWFTKATYENMTEEIFVMYGRQNDLNKTKIDLEENAR